MYYQKKNLYFWILKGSTQGLIGNYNLLNMNEELSLDQFFKNFVRFINRNKSFLIVFIFINLIIVSSYYFIIRPVQYRSIALCTSQIDKFENQREFQRVAIDLINNLQIYIEVRDFEALSDVLSVDLNVAKSFVYINATQLYQLDMNEEYRNVHKFEIELIVNNNKHYDAIEKGILYYFNNNQYLIDISESYITAKISLYNDIVNEIDALQKERNTTRHKGDFIKTEVNSEDAVNEIIALSQKRESTLRDTKISKVFSFVQGFNRLNEPQNNILQWNLITACISFIFGLFISLVREKI